MAALHLSAENFKQEVLEAKGKVLVDFFATWCGPCMQEMPEMNKIYPDYKDKIEFFAVSIDDSRSDYEK